MKNGFQKIFFIAGVIAIFGAISFSNRNTNLYDFSDKRVQLAKSSPSEIAPSIKSAHVKIAGHLIKTEVALTREAQELGLSGRKSLKADESMLFIFDQIDSHPFWMKDMFFPIDIIWLNKDFEVIYIKNNARPESYPSKYGEKVPAKYVLEVVAGFSEWNKLKVGDIMEFFP